VVDPCEPDTKRWGSTQGNPEVTKNMLAYQEWFHSMNEGLRMMFESYLKVMLYLCPN
jgi:hypothetical protein